MSGTTTRLSLPYPGSTDGPDGADVVYWINLLATALDVLVPYGQGLLSGLPPASGVQGRIYWATDTATLYYNDGAAWHPIPPTITEALISLSDVTTNDVSTSKHGFAPKAPNDTTKFLRGDATYAVPGSLIYGPRSTGISTAGGNFAAGADLLAAALSFTADGSSDYEVEVSAPYWWNTNVTENQLRLNLDGADAGYIAILDVTAANTGGPLHETTPILAPSAGVHTVNARLTVSAGTGHIDGAAGGAGTNRPILMKVRKL